MVSDAEELGTAMSLKATSATQLTLNLEANRFGHSGVLGLLKNAEAGRVNLRGVGENESTVHKLVEKLFGKQLPPSLTNGHPVYILASEIK